MKKAIKTALISVFYKDGMEDLLRYLAAQQTTLLSTGGTRKFIEDLGIPCTAVETVTGFPSILDGRVKTLHPKVFGGILANRSNSGHAAQLKEYDLPEIDLVIVDLYPFEATVAASSDEAQIIEKIDIGGPSMIRAAAKNFADVMVVAAKQDYSELLEILKQQDNHTTVEQRRHFAAKAFEVVKQYDIAISNYFSGGSTSVLRYGENAHQKASFTGNLNDIFTQLNGKQLSYNNLVDVNAAIELMQEFNAAEGAVFGIIKHTNVCGIAQRGDVLSAWKDALAGDPQSAFGGVLFCNGTIDASVATAIHEIFFEVLIAPAFTPEAVDILSGKKNRILLQFNSSYRSRKTEEKTLLNGTIRQEKDTGNFSEWQNKGGRDASADEEQDLTFANIVVKHLKSNAIALVKNRQLIGKGCGQTSRIDALQHAIDSANRFGFSLKGAVLASDAFFPFDDCVQLAHQNGIAAFIQPGGSMRDEDSFSYCRTHKLAMVITGLRHFKH